MSAIAPLNADPQAGAGNVGAGAPLNIAIGWTSIATGAVIGLALGMWSFGGPIAVPQWIGDYGALPRRLLRLGHIAFFGLGILNIMLARHLVRCRPFWLPKRMALGAMNFGNLFLPLTLIAAAVFEPAKYLMSLPALAVTFALVVAARTAILDTAPGRW